MHRSFKFCTKVRPQSLMVMPKSDGLHSVMYVANMDTKVQWWWMSYICDVIGNIVLPVQYQRNDRLSRRMRFLTK